MADKPTRISLKVKFFSVVLIFIIISFLIGIVGLWNLSAMKDQITKIVNNSAEKIILATGMEDTSENLSAVAAAAEEMTATIEEVAKNTATSRETTDRAVAHTQTAREMAEIANNLKEMASKFKI